MSPFRQNFVIAELRGWKQTQGDKDAVKAWLEVTGEDMGPYFGMPDYVRDLNAIHNDAELLVLTSTKPYSSNPNDHEPLRYQMHLRKIVGTETREEQVLSGVKDKNGKELILITHVYSNYMEELKVIRATAAQKSEAILKTLNRWEET